MSATKLQATSKTHDSIIFRSSTSATWLLMPKGLLHSSSTAASIISSLRSMLVTMAPSLAKTLEKNPSPQATSSRRLSLTSPTASL